MTAADTQRDRRKNSGDQKRSAQGKATTWEKPPYKARRYHASSGIRGKNPEFPDATERTRWRFVGWNHGEKCHGRLGKHTMKVRQNV